MSGLGGATIAKITSDYNTAQFILSDRAILPKARVQRSIR